MKSSLPFLALVFLSSFLLFSVELIFARLLLPTFGSAASVWTTCLMFYQGLLFLGYWYAGRWSHVMVSRRAFMGAHVVLLALPILVFPFEIEQMMGEPVVAILMALLATVGFPFFALSTTSVVAQTWLTQTDISGHDDPYFLYGMSNAGSLAALLLYPTVIEPQVGMIAQLKLWYGAYFVFVLLIAICVPMVKVSPKSPRAEVGRSHGAEGSGRSLLTTLLLAAGASALLMAITNVVTIDAPVALLWTLPLTLYLLTLIICFKRVLPSPNTINRVAGFCVLLSVLCLVLLIGGFNQQLALVGLGNLVLFVGCLRTHYVLAGLRPKNTERLGRYFLAMSLGGWLGSLLIAVLVPVLFSDIASHAVDCAVAGALLLLAMVLRDADSVPKFLKSRPIFALGILTVAVASVGALSLVVKMGSQGSVASARTFYGLYHVKDEDGLRKLIHGNTVHGLQNLEGDYPEQPLAYYYHRSPVGLALWALQGQRETVAVVGLGAGVLAAYGEAGEQWDLYELDAKVLEFASEHFTYMANSRANLSHFIGDARLTLNQQADDLYDVMILDTFSSDFVPLHLVTVEALSLYRQKLKSDGVLLFHITNRVFELRPIFARLAEQLGAEWAVFAKEELPPGVKQQGKLATTWFVMSWDHDKFEQVKNSGEWTQNLGLEAALPESPWTDDHVNIFEALK